MCQEKKKLDETLDKRLLFLSRAAHRETPIIEYTAVANSQFIHSFSLVSFERSHLNFRSNRQCFAYRRAQRILLAIN